MATEGFKRKLAAILSADVAWPSSADTPPGLSTDNWRDFAGMVQLDPDGLFIYFYVK